MATVTPQSRVGPLLREWRERLSIESLFPADAATAKTLEQLARDRRGP